MVFSIENQTIEPLSIMFILTFSDNIFVVYLLQQKVPFSWQDANHIFKKVEILHLHSVFIKKAKHLILFLILLFLCLLLYFSCSVRVYLYASSKLDTSSKNNSVIDRNKIGGNHSSTVTFITALKRRFSYITTRHPL